MKNHESDPTSGTKITTIVQISACGEVIRFAARAIEISAMTMSSSTTAAAVDHVMSYAAGSSGLFSVADMPPILVTAASFHDDRRVRSLAASTRSTPDVHA